MYLSAKSQYACLAIMQLAESYPTGDPVSIRCIAQQHGIPQKFLVQILLQLKRAGLLTSTRGSQGGYQLVRTPQEITLLDVLSAVDGTEQPLVNAAAKSPYSPALLTCCGEMFAIEQKRLAEITLTELLDRSKQTADLMWYI